MRPRRTGSDRGGIGGGGRVVVACRKCADKSARTRTDRRSYPRNDATESRARSRARESTTRAFCDGVGCEYATDRANEHTVRLALLENLASVPAPLTVELVSLPPHNISAGVLLYLSIYL